MRTDEASDCAKAVGRNKTKKKPAKDVFSLSELFFLVSIANDLDVYAAPHKEKMQRWSELHQKHKDEGYDRPLNSLKRKLEELVSYHMVCILSFPSPSFVHCTLMKDPDSSKVTKATRDLFMTESAQVKFGASLDALKNSWESRKTSDSEKMKVQKVCFHLL